MAKKRFLVVDDEEDILELLTYNLNREGYQVVSASSGETCLQKAASEKPDLIVLDLMLPGIDGLDVTKNLKSNPHTKHIPIIMLTAKGEEADIVTGLELGADDYITKPFSPRILIARARAVIRRNDQSKKDDDLKIIQIHDMVINPHKRETLANAKPLASSHLPALPLYCPQEEWLVIMKKRRTIWTTMLIVLK